MRTFVQIERPIVVGGPDFSHELIVGGGHKKSRGEGFSGVGRRKKSRGEIRSRY